MTGGELTDDELAALYRSDPQAAMNALVAKLIRQREELRGENLMLRMRVGGGTCSACLRMRGDGGGEG